VPAPPALIDGDNWRASRDYLFGCDLFNHGYYWEAHEVWEGLWHVCDRRGAAADALKALIKLAAAGVKAREGRTAGVARHAARAAELFGQVRKTTGPKYLGLDLDRWITTAEELARQPTVPRASNAPVETVFAFRVLPT
jgi:predicted metal-dependent hydrolase